MKILVVGGAGYVGSALIPKLLDRGYDIGVVDLFWFGNYLPKEVKIEGNEIFHLKEEKLKDYDQVIFLAGLSNDPMAECSPHMNFVFNTAAPTYLAYISKRAGVKRFIYASSCSIYGYRVDELCSEESNEILKCRFPYGISKFQGEQGVVQMADSGFSVICLRKGTICGYSPRMRLDLIVNTMFKSAITQNFITITNPSIWRPILSIQDAVTAYIRAIESESSISGIFNIASGNYTVGLVGDLVAATIKESLGLDIKLEIKHIPDLRSYKASIDKAVNVLGFRPLNDVTSIVKDLIANIEKFRDMDNPNYYNIQVFKTLKSWTLKNL